MGNEPKESGIGAVTNIAAKMLAVMNECSHIAKNGKNDFHQYKYATSADVLEKVNSAFTQYGISSLARPKLISLENVVNAKGNTEHLATVQMFIRLIDVETGEFVEICGLGNGQDSGDKAVQKAQTAAIKYAYMLTFNISTGDDPEADKHTDEFTEGFEPQRSFPAVKQAPAQPTLQEVPSASVPPAARTVRRTSAKSNGCICSDCGMAITAKVDGFSRSRFGRSLCMDCQKQQQSA